MEAISSRRARFQSERTAEFTESVIREMSRLALQHKAVNLAQGFPDFPAPAEIKEAARAAIARDIINIRSRGGRVRCVRPSHRNIPSGMASKPILSAK